MAQKIRMQTQFGTALQADFEEQTWTFLMKDKYAVSAGEFAIVDKYTYDELMAALQELHELRIQTVPGYKQVAEKIEAALKLL